MKIKDEFSGYLNVGNDACAYCLTHDKVTLLPATSDEKEKYEVFDRINSNITSEPIFFYGNDEDGAIALMHRGKFYTDSLGLGVSLKFSTPVIVKACGNAVGFWNSLTDGWNKFHTIEFCGGNINALYDPGMALESSKTINSCVIDGSRQIKLRPWNDYTKRVKFEIDNEEIELTLSIRQGSEKHNVASRGAYELGKLDSFIRLSFTDAKDFIDIEKYFLLIRKLVALLTAQRNVYFENISLFQKTSEDKIIKTASCKIFDVFENYANRSYLNVISLISVWDWLPGMLSKIYKNKAETIFDILPENNKLLYKICITDVQNLCTALEVSYHLDEGRKREKDEIIKNLKNRIKETIKDFLETQSEIDVNQETTISSAFDYLDLTAKHKVLTLYAENKEVVDAIIQKHALPSIDYDEVAKFIRLRDTKTHTGAFEWGDSAKIYLALMAIVYSVFFKCSGIPDSIIKDIVPVVF